MKFNVTPIPSSLFTYHAPTKTFVTEASDLNGYDFLQRFYDDATDRGFSIKSTKTGRVVPFYYVGKLEQQEQFDGELHGWLFSSDPNDGHGTFHVHILND